MGQDLELTDIPVAVPGALELLGRLAVKSGRGLLALNGATEEDREAIEAEFWQAYRGSARDGVVALVRFWSLIDVFGARRLKQRFLDEGLSAFNRGLTAAGQLRLNAHWGFNPQRLIWALDLLAADAVSDDFVRAQPDRVAVGGERFVETDQVAA